MNSSVSLLVNKLPAFYITQSSITPFTTFVRILNHINPAYALVTDFFKNHFNIIFQFTSRSSKWSCFPVHHKFYKGLPGIETLPPQKCRRLTTYFVLISSLSTTASDRVRAVLCHLGRPLYASEYRHVGNNKKQ